MNVSEFRRNLKKCLDRAANGEIIEIERGGLIFYLAKRDFGRITLNEASILPEEALKKINPVASPHIKIASTPPGDNGFIEAGEYGKAWNEGRKHHLNVPQTTAGESPCCSTKKPCRHWQWDSDNTVWVNSLSGRERSGE